VQAKNHNLKDFLKGPERTRKGTGMFWDIQHIVNFP